MQNLHIGNIDIVGDYINNNNTDAFATYQALEQQLELFNNHASDSVLVQVYGCFPFIISRKSNVQISLRPCLFVKNYESLNYWLGKFQNVALSPLRLHMIGKLGYYNVNPAVYTGLVYITRGGYLWTKVSDISPENLEHYLEFYNQDAEESFEYDAKEMLDFAVSEAIGSTERFAENQLIRGMTNMLITPLV